MALIVTTMDRKLPQRPSIFPIISEIQAEEIAANIEMVQEEYTALHFFFLEDAKLVRERLSTNYYESQYLEQAPKRREEDADLARKYEEVIVPYIEETLAQLELLKNDKTAELPQRPPTGHFVLAARDALGNAPQGMELEVHLPPLSRVFVSEEAFGVSLSSLLGFTATLKLGIRSPMASMEEDGFLTVLGLGPDEQISTQYALPRGADEVKMSTWQARKTFSDFRAAGGAAAEALRLACEKFDANPSIGI